MQFGTIVLSDESSYYSRADKKLWNKIHYKNCASRWSLIRNKLPLLQTVHTGYALQTISMEVKWPGREADDLLTPSSVELKNEWSFTANPTYAFIKCAESHKNELRTRCGQYDCNFTQIKFI